MRRIRRKLRIAAAWIALVLSGVGTVGILAAPAKDRQSEKELEKVLEANRKLIETKLEKGSIPEQGENSEEQRTSESEESAAGTNRTEDGKKEDLAKNTAVDWNQVTAVGDSVMLGAAGAMLEEMPGCVIDAKESRQAYAAPELLKELNTEGKLKNTVILALGTNGAFEESEGQAILDYLGTDRTVYWVTVYGTNLSYAAKVNRVIESLAEKNENLKMIPWDQEVSKHPEWLYGDGIHVNADGQKGYAKLVREILSAPNVKNDGKNF